MNEVGDADLQASISPFQMWHWLAGEPLKHGGFGPQYGGTSYQERVSRMQSRTGEAMRTPYPQANTHVRFDANGDGTGTPGTNRSSRRRYGRR